MPDTELNIILTLIDKASDGFKKISSSVEETSRIFKNLGREVSQVGSTMTMMGASITGPFALAFKNASENIAEVNQVTLNIQNTFDAFQEKIATAIVPIVQKMSDTLSMAFNAFNSLSPEIQKAIIQSTFLVGVFATLGGGILFASGKVMALVGNIGLLISQFLAFAAVNAPLMILLGVVVAIGAAMWKWKPVADAVLSTFQALFIFLKNGFLTIKIALEQLLFGVMQQLQTVVDLMARVPGPAQNAIRMLSNEVQNLSNNIRSGINNDLQGMAENVETLNQIFETGSGSWANGFDNLKISIDSALQKLMQGNSIVQTSAATWKKNYDGMKSAVGELQSALAGAAAQNKSLAVAAQVVAIGMATMNTAEGVTRAFKDYAWPWSLVVAAIIGAAGAIQVATIASQQFAEGTDTVPAMLSPGEMVFPRSMADAIRSGAITVGGPGGQLNQGPIYIDINIDRPVISNEGDSDYLAEKVSRLIAQEVERIR